MLLDNLLAYGQSNAGTGERFPCVQALEHAENLFEVLRVNSQSVVLHRECPFPPAAPGGGNMYPRNSRPLVLDGVADEVLK